MCAKKFLAWFLQKVQKYFVCKLVFNFCLMIDTAPANTPLWIICRHYLAAIYFRSNLQYSKQYKNDYHQKYRRENKPDDNFSCKWRKLPDAYFTLVRLAIQVFVKAFYAVIIKVHNFIFCFSFFYFQCAPRFECCKPDVTLQKLYSMTCPKIKNAQALTCAPSYSIHLLLRDNFVPNNKNCRSLVVVPYRATFCRTLLSVSVKANYGHIAEHFVDYINIVNSKPFLYEVP